MNRTTIYCICLVLCMGLACKKDTPEKKDPPKAGFNFTINNAGLLPANVSFTATATNATQYFWDFGDGNTSTEVNPVRTFPEAKTYNVKLVATGANGKDSIIKSVAITQSKPKAGFSYSLLDEGAYPTHVKFTNRSTGAAAYKWLFDNGDSSQAENPVDSFFTANTYNVKLIATNAAGSDTTTQPLVISFTMPKALFTYKVLDAGNYPTHISFTNASTAATSYKWVFDNGRTSTGQNPTDSFFAAKTFNVKLIATSPVGEDSVTVPISVSINKPTASFSYLVTNSSSLPLNIISINNSQKADSYKWDWGDGSATSSAIAPVHTYTQGGTYTITLSATNPGGTAVATQVINVSPYPVSYTNFNGAIINLYAWEGRTVALLSRNKDLDPVTMFAWAKIMDSVYGYYRLCTGRDPGVGKMINGHTTVADIATTCGAGCGYLGATGIELQNAYFDVMYNGIKNNNQYDQAVFYEFGRNFWFYGNQLAYKANDPVVTGYAVLMRFLSLDATGVQGGPFGSMTYSQFKNAVESLVDKYSANTSLNWSNTLGQGTGVPGEFGGGTDLFASFCMRLMRDYGGQNFIQQVWKKAATMPNAATTQDAVDNFILASCAAANKNLTALFTTTWRWPMSDAAKVRALMYP